jgi:site-specific recombinase XerD
MKHLPLHNPTHERIIAAFAHWLQLLNYEPSTVYGSPIRVREFFHWLEEYALIGLEQVNRKTIAAYFDYLQHRPSQRKGGRLSVNYLKSHLKTLRQLARYLQETEQGSFAVDIRLPGSVAQPKVILTKEEVYQLYRSTHADVLGLRDRAILSVYYGCGLRRNEGVSLTVDDVVLSKGLLLVRKGKNYQQRYVPMSDTVQQHLQTYLQEARPVLLGKKNTPVLFLGISGQPLAGPVMRERFQRLLQRADINKPATLHSLRHAIATHLLQSGMALDHIRRFLGHRSLESTQIYTHIVHEQTKL